MPGLNPKRVTLDNGVTVIVKANHTNPTVSIVVGVRTGAYVDLVAYLLQAFLCIDSKQLVERAHADVAIGDDDLLAAHRCDPREAEG